MKVGDRVGIGSDGAIHLYCIVNGFKGDITTFDAINGGWTLKMRGGAIGWLSEKQGGSEAEAKPLTVMFQGPIPRQYRGDYNEAIWYMQQRYQDGPLTKWCRQIRARCQQQIWRLRHAIKAFKDSWRGSLARTSNGWVDFEIFDDDIPF